MKVFITQETTLKARRVVELELVENLIDAEAFAGRPSKAAASDCRRQWQSSTPASASLQLIVEELVEQFIKAEVSAGGPASRVACQRRSRPNHAAQEGAQQASHAMATTAAAPRRGASPREA